LSNFTTTTGLAFSGGNATPDFVGAGAGGLTGNGVPDATGDDEAAGLLVALAASFVPGGTNGVADCAIAEPVMLRMIAKTPGMLLRQKPSRRL